MIMCTCQKCNELFGVDVGVPDSVWSIIREDKYNLLCPDCIFIQIYKYELGNVPVIVCGKGWGRQEKENVLSLLSEVKDECLRVFDSDPLKHENNKGIEINNRRIAMSKEKEKVSVSEVERLEARIRDLEWHNSLLRTYIDKIKAVNMQLLSEYDCVIGGSK